MTKKNKKKPSKRGKAKKKSLHCSSGTVTQKSYVKKWTMNMVARTKLLQKSGIRKNVVIELIYRGFI